MTGFSNSSVALNQANAISNLSAFTASSGFALTNGQTLNTNGTVDAGSGGLSLTTTAGGINVFRPLTASSGTVTLTAAGSIVEDVTFGVITVQIIEGSLARIDVEGHDWFRAGYLRDRIERGAQTPLRLEPLQERLQLLQQDPRIEA